MVFYRKAIAKALARERYPGRDSHRPTPAEIAAAEQMGREIQGGELGEGWLQSAHGGGPPVGEAFE